MAEILISYDTVKKTAKVTTDGKKTAFTSIQLNKKYDSEEYNFELVNYISNEEDGSLQVYRMMCEKYDKDDVVTKLKEYFNKSK